MQLSNKHRVTATYTLNKLLSDPDTLNSRDVAFPGFPIHGVQDSKRFAYQGSLRSALTPNLVNDLRVFGATGGATLFSTEITPALFSGSVANQGGRHLNINGACCGTGQLLMNPSGSIGALGGAAGNPQNISSREASTKVAHDSLNWVRGAHNLNFGVEFTQADVWLQNQSLVPRIDFGINNSDPAFALFNTTNFPGASDTVLAQRARPLRDPHRPRHRHPRQRPAQRERPVRIPRLVDGPGTHAPARLLRPGLLAGDART